MINNRVILIGYVGKHLETKKLDNGAKRVGIRVATHDRFKNNKGEKVDQTVWHNIVAWGSTAEYAERSFVRGSKIMVEGSIDYREFTGRDGKVLKRTHIKALSLMNLDR